MRGLGLITLAVLAATNCGGSGHKTTVASGLSAPANFHDRASTTTSTSDPPHPPTSHASRSRSTVAQAAVGSVVGAGDIYDQLAMCESGMNAKASGTFHGAFQWMLSTWHSLGQTGTPEDYDYAYQKSVVVRFMPISSWHSQFPVCSRKIGV